MTICISVKVHDCLVFAADSATSIFMADAKGNPLIAKVFRHGNKVFNLCKGLPVAAMTCGMGNIGEASVATLTKDFRQLAKEKGGKYFIDPKKYTIQEFAEKAHGFFFDDKYKSLAAKPKGDHSFEFWIGGYGSDEHQSQIWKVQIVNEKSPGPIKVRDAGDLGINAAGQPEAFNRLVVGFGTQLGEALKTLGVPASDLPKALDAIQQQTQANLAYASMPIQDAIRLADYLVETTKGFVSFVPGADTVGGDTDIAAITKHEGFKWVRRKHYYNSELNPLETDHA